MFCKKKSTFPKISPGSPEDKKEIFRHPKLQRLSIESNGTIEFFPQFWTEVTIWEDSIINRNRTKCKLLYLNICKPPDFLAMLKYKKGRFWWFIEYFALGSKQDTFKKQHSEFGKFTSRILTSQSGTSIKWYIALKIFVLSPGVALIQHFSRGFLPVVVCR